MANIKHARLLIGLPANGVGPIQTVPAKKQPPPPIWPTMPYYIFLDAFKKAEEELRQRRS